MVGGSLVFVFCLPQLTMLAAKKQAKIKLPTTMLCKTVKAGKISLLRYAHKPPK